MAVEPDGQQPIDDEIVAPEEKTANIDRSFDRSLPPGETRKAQKGVSTRSEQFDGANAKDQSETSDGIYDRAKSASNNAEEDEFEVSMSILQTERSIAENPDTAPKRQDTSVVDESKPDTAEDSLSGRSSPIGRYQVRRLLGQGAFGRVYEAHDPQLDRRVAVKVSKDLKGTGAIDRFLREARSAAHLRHPNIIPVYEYGQIDDMSMIVYELVDGETLRSYIKRKAPLELSNTISIIRKIADGLNYAHQQGIIHRDVKPDNVLIDEKGEPHIADFGCARRFDDQDVHQTIEGSILGTPMYMSPEQASGQAHQADGRTDVWSLGVMLYEMVAGQRPFDGKLSDLLHLIRHHDPKPLRKAYYGTPRDIETICSKCLTRDLDQRFATAGELADELERFERGEPIVSRRINPFARTWLWAKRNRAVASLLSAVAILLLAGTIISGAAYLITNSALNEKNIADENRVRVTIDQLTTAESSSLENILKFMNESKSSMVNGIRQDLSQTEPSDNQKKQRRLNLALLYFDDDQDRSDWFNMNRELFLSADGYELRLFCDAFSKTEKNAMRPKLRDISLDAKETNERRLRAICALAQIETESDREKQESYWEKIAPDVVGYLTAMNLDEVQQWIPTIMPVGAELKSELLHVFKLDRTLDDASPETASEILSSLFKEDPQYIVKTLMPLADARQLNHLIAALESKRDNGGEISAVKSFLLPRLNEISKQSQLEPASNIEIANLILALIQLNHSDETAWTVHLKRGEKENLTIDNSVGTEVIERLGPASTSVQLMREMIGNEWHAYAQRKDPNVLAVELLALGQFNKSQLPETIIEQSFKPILLDIFQNHGDARVHSSARWLLAKWNFDDEIRSLEDRTWESGGLQTKWPIAGNNWHTDMSGNTFVVFDVEDFDLNDVRDFDPDRDSENWPDQEKLQRFGISIQEVTFEQFKPYIEERLDKKNKQLAEQPDNKNLKPQFDRYNRYKKYFKQELEIPVVEIDYYLALEFCKWLSKRTTLGVQPPSIGVGIADLESFYFIREPFDLGESDKNSVKVKDPGELKGREFFNISNPGYRLPTIREWEYACQAWTGTERSFGDDNEMTKHYASYILNSGKELSRVTQLKPSEAGLFDMFGNVAEWCLDDEDDGRTAQGGSFNSYEIHTTMEPQRLASTHPGKDIGFRIARTYPPLANVQVEAKPD